MTDHRCYPGDSCDWCERRAEARKDDQEPDYDLDAAADSYERQFE